MHCKVSFMINPPKKSQKLTFYGLIKIKFLIFLFKVYSINASQVSDIFLYMILKRLAYKITPKRNIFSWTSRCKKYLTKLFIDYFLYKCVFLKTVDNSMHSLARKNDQDNIFFFFFFKSIYTFFKELHVSEISILI